MATARSVGLTCHGKRGRFNRRLICRTRREKAERVAPLLRIIVMVWDELASCRKVELAARSEQRRRHGRNAIADRGFLATYPGFVTFCTVADVAIDAESSVTNTTVCYRYRTKGLVWMLGRSRSAQHEKSKHRREFCCDIKLSHSFSPHYAAPHSDRQSSAHA